MQYSPNLFSPERWQYMLDLADHEKMVSVATSAIHSAESEVEDIMAGEEVSPPEFYEDHVAKLKVFYAALQSRAFKEEADNDIYETFIQHVSLQEQMALDRAVNSPLISAELATLKLYPITPALQAQAKEIVKSLEQQMAMVQGQANRGEEVDGQIPGTDSEGAQ